MIIDEILEKSQKIALILNPKAFTYFIKIDLLPYLSCQTDIFINLDKKALEITNLMTNETYYLVFGEDIKLYNHDILLASLHIDKNTAFNYCKDDDLFYIWAIDDSNGSYSYCVKNKTEIIEKINCLSLNVNIGRQSYYELSNSKKFFNYFKIDNEVSNKYEAIFEHLIIQVEKENLKRSR